MLVLRDNELPLVTIIIITYNSSKYVLETLESCKNQTYKQIELIISDDYSTDNTVFLCNEWGENNNDRFVSFKIIESKMNTGIPGNCNRGLKNSNGKWIKFIAGDDILNIDCVKEFVSFSFVSKGQFYFSNFDLIDEKSIEYQDINNSYIISPTFYNKEPEKQYKDLIFEKYLIPAPTSFINKKALIDLKGFDEEITFCEDYPLWLKATKSGVKLLLLNKKLVKYRIYPESVSKKNNSKYKNSLRKMFFKYRFKPMLKYNPFLGVDMAIRFYYINNGIIYKYIKFLLPLTYINYLKRILKN
jgi:glycosyltransferase involved in cell wall biosynthesis